MRTKTLLLSAAALLAAGIVSSQAQPVYSQNVVGYATMTLASGFNMLTVPFQVGASNGANEIFGASLPDGTDLYVWDQNHGKFVIDVYDTGGGFNTPPYWFMSDDATPTNIPVLPAGKGFFMVPQGAVTNTFAGVVAVNVGSSNVMTLASGFNMVGSVIPAAGAVNGSLINLTNLPDGTDFYVWDQSHGKYIIDVFDTGGGFNSPPYWFMSDDATPTNPPSITVGQGFFIVPQGSATWVETLPSN